MKQFSYTWSDEIFLLHIELNRGGSESGGWTATVIRGFADGRTQREGETAAGGGLSHRFMISRSHPEELRLTIEYPDDVVLKAYELDDRAYYPTKPLFEA